MKSFKLQFYDVFLSRPCCHAVIGWVAVCIVLYCIVFVLGKSTDTVYSRKGKENKKLKKTHSLRYIDTDFRWADSRGIRYNRFYVIANYVTSVVQCIHFIWSSAGPRRGLCNNRELRYIGLHYIDSWLYSTHVLSLLQTSYPFQC